jgi:hypothetical protein
MPPVQPSRERDKKAESWVADLLQSHGWKIKPSQHAAGSGADLILQRDGLRFVAEVKALGEGRADRALPLLALAILQARAHARELHGAAPLAVLWVERPSPNLASHLRAFAERHADGVPVGIVSPNGFRHFIGHPFDALNAGPREENWRSGQPSRQVVNLFSDLNQWMLKLLVARDIPEALLNAPRLDYRSGAELAAAAGASAMSASRFLQQLRSEGFLEDSRGLRLVRRQELFARWRAAVLRPAPEMAMRFVLRAPVRPQLQELVARQSGQACLGLFAAAEELRLGHVSGVPAHVLVPKLPQVDDRQWRGLLPVAQGTMPDLILRQAAFPQSLFRGAVHRDGWLVSDVIQTWLDAGGHPARGTEQADLIYERSLRGIVEEDRSR